MASDFILISLAVLLVLFCTMSFFYWMVVQPVLLRGYVYRVFALRDRLRWALIEGEISVQDAHVHTLEHIIGAIIANAPIISLGDFILFCAKARHSSVPEKIERYLRDAPEIVKEMNRAAMEASFVIMLINAPLLFSLFALPVVLTAPRKNAKEVIAKHSESSYAGLFISKMPAPAKA
jgi:hypothetical protein